MTADRPDVKRHHGLVRAAHWLNAIVLLGMIALGNWGREYGTAFNAIYPELAAKYRVPLYPFFLEGVAQDPALNQEDGLHPNAKGVARIVGRIAPFLERVLKDGA